MKMLFCIGALALAACASGTGWPTTRMVPVADYAAAPHQTVSAAPAYTAGPSTVRTTSPDGSTAFACTDGSTVSGAAVPPHSDPAC